jgi:hypothetical protein
MEERRPRSSIVFSHNELGPMRRSLLAAVLAVVLHIASLSAQQSSGWGDELPPAPPLPDSLFTIPTVSIDLTPPAPPLTRPPSPVRAIYINAWAFGGRRFYDLIKLADRTEINSFVVDVKDDTGYLTYRSDVPTAKEIGANSQLRARDVRERLRVMREHGIHPIARIVVAKDPLLASRKPAWSVRHVDGGLWHDRLDFAWVDAFNDSVWVYAAQLAAEAVKLGFAEVQYDYVRFPDEPESRLASAVFAGRRPGETKRQGVARNLKLLGERTRRLGVPFTIDVFGLTTSAPTDMGIGRRRGTADGLSQSLLPGLLQPAPSQQRAVQSDPAGDAGRAPALGAAGQDGGNPAVPAGLHPGPAALHSGPRARTDPRRRGARHYLLGAVESTQRV